MNLLMQNWNSSTAQAYGYYRPLQKNGTLVNCLLTEFTAHMSAIESLSSQE